MTIIDLKNDISHPYMTVSNAAILIGVAESTIYRWKRNRKKETYNNYLLVFTETKLPDINFD